MTSNGNLPACVRPLRGRVVLRPHEPRRIGLIHLPDQSADWTREAQKKLGIKAKSSHRGTVLAMGEPALSSGGVEVEPGFAVGDDVVFVWKHSEKNFTQPWVDGGPCCWVGQEHVLAVHEDTA